jgi:hypothetical protein
MFSLGLVCLASFSVAQRSDQLAAERILGPYWRQLSRSAGMIFSGTVLAIEAQPVRKGRPLPLVLTKFRVDRAIVGTRVGEVLTVREWEGAWSMQRPMSRGERVLIFLYPPSRLGLTSPVGGRLGQVALDSRGEIVYTGVPLPDSQSRLLSTEATQGVGVTSGAKAQFHNSSNAALKRCSTQSHAQSPAQGPTLSADCTVSTQRAITLTQLERAIRDARMNPDAKTDIKTKE